jgi:SPP1 family predicted phage head-tail adaptor
MQLKSNLGNRQFISLDDVCYLITTESNQDEIGNSILTEKEMMVWCSKLSITRAEFNAAGSLGFKPDMMLVIDAEAYDDEKKVKYEGKKYSIYKTYLRADGFIELYCEVRINE